MKTRKAHRFVDPRWSFARASMAAVLAASLAVTPAQGAFHLWQIREVYTDASGHNQFVELFCPSSGQTFVTGQQITVSSGGTNHTFTLSHGLAGDSLNHALLFGTAGTTNLGSPNLDYTIPDNFIFPGGGTISFFGANSGAYTALPTDGVQSRTWGDGNAANNPQNFAGQIGFIVPGNSPPSISITNPADGSLFAAPATVPVSVSASDDGTVVNVRLLTNGVPAATNTTAPFGFTLSDLPGGNYTLQAVAQDDGSLSTTSALVVIKVVERPVLSLSPPTSGPIKFQYSTMTGINYVVERATGLTGFSAVVTNSGTGGVLEFEETDGSASQRSYRVRLQ